jgi:hypothetical protein
MNLSNLGLTIFVIVSLLTILAVFVEFIRAEFKKDKSKADGELIYMLISSLKNLRLTPKDLIIGIFLFSLLGWSAYLHLELERANHGHYDLHSDKDHDHRYYYSDRDHSHSLEDHSHPYLARGSHSHHTSEIYGR